MIVAIALTDRGLHGAPPDDAGRGALPRLIATPIIRPLRRPAVGLESDRQRAGRASNDNGSGEHLSDSDRRALDEVIRRKTGGH